MKLSWKIYHVIREWQCRTFGHKAYWEYNSWPPGWQCKRGCGPCDALGNDLEADVPWKLGPEEHKSFKEFADELEKMSDEEFEAFARAMQEDYE